MQARDKICMLKYHEKRRGTLHVPPRFCIHHANAAHPIYEAVTFNVSRFPVPRYTESEKGSTAELFVWACRFSAPAWRLKRLRGVGLQGLLSLPTDPVDFVDVESEALESKADDQNKEICRWLNDVLKPNNFLALGAADSFLLFFSTPAYSLLFCALVIDVNL